MIGYKFFKEKNIVWREHQSTLIPLSPPHSLAFSREDAVIFLKNKHYYFIRWESHFDESDDGYWWHVIKSEKEELSNLASKVRYKIRRAQKEYYIEKCDKDFILEKGYFVYCEAYTRYETHEPKYTLEQFQHGIINLPEDTDFFGIFDHENRNLVGFSENYIELNTCFYVTTWVTPTALRKLAGYLLFHTMNKYYLNELDFDYISNGTRSISHDTNIQEYLIKNFRFRKAYSNLEIIYKFPISHLIAIIFPFRKLFYPIKGDFFRKISILMKQEEIYRKCKEIT